MDSDPYRQTAVSHLTDENRRLTNRVKELELLFEGILPYQENRGICPFCKINVNTSDHNSGRITNTPVLARHRWLWRRAIPAHVLRQHRTIRDDFPACGAVWKEMMPMDLVKHG